MRPLDYLWTPTLVFVVVYLILMKENNLLALEIRYRLSVIGYRLSVIGYLWLAFLNRTTFFARYDE